MKTAGSGKVRVVLVDDHAVVRTGYRRLLELEDDFAVVGEHAGADEALNVLARTDAQGMDVLVLDLSMPGRSGLDLLRRVVPRWPALRVLVVSMHDNPAMVAQALRAGAAGYVTKGSQPDELVQALRRVARGERAELSADVARHTVFPQVHPHDALSAREFEVLRLLASGHTLESIAERLHVSSKTVSNYQTSVRQKLGVNTAVDLLGYAQAHGLSDWPPEGAVPGS